MTTDEIDAIARAVTERIMARISCAAEDDRLLSANECAELLGISRHAWYRRAKEPGAPPAIGGERNRRWRKSSVLRWIEHQERAAKIRRQA